MGNELTVGTWVRWNGSGSARNPRYYTGQITEVTEDTYVVVDNEWHATSEMAKSRAEEVFFPGC